MNKFWINVQNKETCIKVTGGAVIIEDVVVQIKKLYPKVQIRCVGLSTAYLRMKMTKTQQQIVHDYLSFMFN